MLCKWNKAIRALHFFIATTWIVKTFYLAMIWKNTSYKSMAPLQSRSWSTYNPADLTFDSNNSRVPGIASFTKYNLICCKWPYLNRNLFSPLWSQAITFRRDDDHNNDIRKMAQKQWNHHNDISAENKDQSSRSPPPWQVYGYELPAGSALCFRWIVSLG